jgi:hypothetical protein
MKLRDDPSSIGEEGGVPRQIAHRVAACLIQTPVGQQAQMAAPPTGPMRLPPVVDLLGRSSPRSLRAGCLGAQQDHRLISRLPFAAPPWGALPQGLCLWPAMLHGSGRTIRALWRLALWPGEACGSPHLWNATGPGTAPPHHLDWGTPPIGAPPPEPPGHGHESHGDRAPGQKRTWDGAACRSGFAAGVRDTSEPRPPAGLPDRARQG